MSPGTIYITGEDVVRRRQPVKEEFDVGKRSRQGISESSVDLNWNLNYSSTNHACKFNITLICSKESLNDTSTTELHCEAVNLYL